jgi:inorganic triphosphatase YgiF
MKLDAGMVEREVKLEIPASQVDGVVAAMGERARPLQLHALYFDTPDQALARAGIGLRVRREGKAWFQTLKARGSSLLERIEDTVPLRARGAKSAPVPDLSLHALPEVAILLRQAFDGTAGHPFPALALAFEVRMDRLLLDVRQGDSLVELALDRGYVEAGGRRQPVCELELELKQGRFADVLHLARHWRAQHGLWISVDSKAARGWRLVRGALAGPAVGARPAAAARDAGITALSRSALASCLDHAVANASEIGAGSRDAEHVHQLRVAIRRLRTALRELPLHDAPLPDFEPALVETFRALGRHRDANHVLDTVQPQVEAAGGPPVVLAEVNSSTGEIGDVVRAAAFQDALLALLAVASEQGDGPGASARKAVRPALDKLWRQVVKDGRRFTALPSEAQHRVRKRLKRLRYLSEFVAPVFGHRRVARFLEQLKPVQEVLGTYNDEDAALQQYRLLAVTQPQALFAAGWLQGRQNAQAHACRKALRRLARAEPFWT